MAMDAEPPYIFLQDVDGKITCLFWPDSGDRINDLNDAATRTQLLYVNAYLLASRSGPIAKLHIFPGPQHTTNPCFRRSLELPFPVGDPEKQQGAGQMVVESNGTINIELDDKSNRYTLRALGVVLIVGAFGVMTLAIYIVGHYYL
ncbi:hypothetical protein B0H11DRAFT_2205848 [Mycena galericulata]|nr:hypothetical protein B0H11DRAFT_2205848 [Mycena galericulata]